MVGRSGDSKQTFFYGWPDGSTFKLHHNISFGKEGNTTNKSTFFNLLVLHKVSNDISNIDHFVSIHISY